MTSSNEIRSQMIKAGGHDFEVFMCGDGEKLAMCLHGFPDHAMAWRYQLPFLARLGYTVWAPNLRGYGRSYRPKGVESYKIDNLLFDISELIKASGKTPSLLIGHDWGGSLAWTFAMRKALPLDHLVIMNCPHPGRISSPFKALIAQPKKFVHYFFFQIPLLPELSLGRNRAAKIGTMFSDITTNPANLDSTAINAIRAQAAEPGALTAMINWYRAAWRYKPQEWLTRPMIDTPTLMIWGETGSPLLKKPTPEDIEGLKRVARSTREFVSNFTLRFLSEVSHWAPQEAPDSINAIMAAWLKGAPIPERGPDGRHISID